MKQFTIDYLARLLADHEPPCISLYQPTHRHRPDCQQDPIRYRNLLRRMEASLREKYPKREVRELMERFQALARDTHFWNFRTDGLAILGSGEMFQVFDLQRPVKELLIVADSFHVKPLLRVYQSADRFQVLCLNRREAKLHEGNRYALDPVDPAGVPSTIDEALGGDLTEPHLTVSSHGDGAGGRPMYHGQGSKKDEIDIDTERFFRAVDRAVLERHSRPSGLPLLLAAPAEYHATFRKASRNPFLMADGLMVNPEALGADELREAAWRKREPIYLERLAGLVDEFRSAASREAGSDDIEQVARAAVAGRVATLLVEDDREIPGRIDPATGRIDPGDLADPEIGDLLDDLTVIVFRLKGEIVVVPPERMPTGSGVAATYRF